MGRSLKPVLGGRASVRVAIVQKAPRFMDREASVAKACAYIAGAGKGGADLIVFPEVWLCGYPYWTEGWDTQIPKFVEGRVRFRDAAILVPSEDTDRLGEAARRANAHVVIGCNEIDPRPNSGTIYNTLLFFNRDGTLMGKKRKLMPTFSERLYWGVGDGADLPVFETDIGRIGGLICGENLMTLARATLIAQGEDFHVAVFPGSFALHSGPMLEEPDKDGSSFWGHVAVRQHALEAGCFVVSACGYITADDIDDDFPHKASMNIAYAHGGSSVISPLGVPLVPPTLGDTILYADCVADMIKATKAIVDTTGHYGRPDVFQLLVRDDAGWRKAGTPSMLDAPEQRALLRARADYYEVDESLVETTAEKMGLLK
jgi:nitrilase